MQNDVFMGKDRKYMGLEPWGQRESVGNTRRGGGSVGITKQCSETGKDVKECSPDSKIR